jgi:hypothetical protein|tara:strand:- start:55 stop:441 length:387 start_codon:yes stop_codon:yes gene_type:complete
MSLPILKRDIRKHYLDYTWLISGVLYEGGTDVLIPELMKRGINEVCFYNVAGSPIGRKSVAGVADSFDVEQFHVVVSADQAENIFDYIYRFCDLSRPNKGFINMNKLSRSTQLDLPDLNDIANEEISD